MVGAYRASDVSMKMTVSRPFVPAISVVPFTARLMTGEFDRRLCVHWASAPAENTASRKRPVTVILFLCIF